MSSSVRVVSIGRSDVDNVWPSVAHYIQQAIDKSAGEFGLDDIHQSLLKADRALWVVYRGDEPIAAITTRIDLYPTGLKACIIDFAGGKDWADWAWFPEYIEPIYKAAGCDILSIAGRLGWMRLYAARGFTPKYLVLHKEIK